MGSVELRNKNELTSIAGTENVYIQEAGSPYTVKRTLLNTIKSWIKGTSTVLKSSSYVVLDNDGYERIEVDTTSGDITITLPLMANNRGRRIEIANIKGGTNKVIISPNATDANKLSSNALNVMWLPKIGDFIVFQESVNSGYWEIINERITSQLRLNTYAGYGSTDNRIMRFTNSVENVGNMFSENHSTGYSSNAKGLEITINKSGRYSFAWSYISSATNYDSYGLSINSNQLSTSISSITATNRLTIDNPQAGYGGNLSISLYLNKNDVIRPHTADAYIPVNVSYCIFTASYLGQ